MKRTFYYCNYCKQRINGQIYWEPCYDCKELLVESLQERKKYNRFNIFGQIWLIPIKYSDAVLLGEGKLVVHYMKRLAKKSGQYQKGHIKKYFQLLKE